VLSKAGLQKEYIIMPLYTNRDITTFWDVDCEKVVMVVRGTDDKDVLGMKYSDLYTDAHLALGLLNRTKRYKEAERMFLKLKAKYGDNVSLSGNSLDGLISWSLSKKYHCPAIIYNQATSPFDSTYNKGANPYTTHYTTNSLKNITIDPLSVSSMLSQTHHIEVPIDTPIIGLPSHSIDHFTKR